MSTISVLPSLTNELIQFILRICKAIILVVYDDDDLLHLVLAPPDVQNLAIHPRNGTRLLKDIVNVQNYIRMYKTVYAWLSLKSRSTTRSLL